MESEVEDDPYTMQDGSTSTNPADLILGEQNAAKTNAFGGFDEDPAKAVRAQELSEATGVHPALVMNDLENFDKQNKAAMTSRILNDNAYLQRYLIEDPLAAAISNDDYSQLDEATQRVLEFSKHTSAPKEFARAAAGSALPAIGSLPAMSAGAEVGAEAGAMLGPWGALGGGLIGGALGGLGAGTALTYAQDWLLSKLPEGVTQAVGLDPESRALGAKAHPTASFLGGLAPFAATLKPTGAGLGERAISAAAQGGFEAGNQAVGDEPMNWEHVALATVFGGVMARPNTLGEPFHDAGIRAGEAFIAKTAPYIRVGQEPPVGIDPNIDKVKLQENEAGVGSLDEALATVQTSSTKERSPNTMADYLRLHTEASIGIEPDAIKALYGDNPSHPDDGLLGWVPNLENQLILADLSGADVRIPVADWLAKVDPGVAKTLRDGIRIRPEGMTKLEGDKPMPEQSDLPPNDVFDLVRESAGLKPIDPVLGAPRRSLTMVEVPQEGAAANFKGLDAGTIAQRQGLDWNKLSEAERKPYYDLVDDLSKTPTYYEFHLQDNTGGRVGMLDIGTADGGKTLLIENIYGIGGDNTIDKVGVSAVNNFGPSTVRDLLRQVRERFPNVEKIEGFRVSGARDKAGTTGVATLDLTKPPKVEDFEMVADNMNRKDYDKVIPPTAQIGGKPVQIGEYMVKPEYSFPVREAIDQFDISQLRDVPKALAAFFGDKLKRQVGDVNVSVVSDADIDAILGASGANHLSGAPAIYNTKLDRIFISNTALRGNKELLRQAVYEEAAHAFTAKALQEDKVAYRNVNDLMDEMKAHLDEVDPAAASEFEYYLDNPFEFIAAGYSFPKMQEAMATIPVSKELAKRLNLGYFKRNVWEAVKALVKELLQKVIGIRPGDTILDGIFNISQGIEQHRALRQQTEGMTLGSQPPIDEAAAIGMTKPQYAKYQELIAKQQEDLAKAKVAKAYDQQERRLGKEWKEKEAEERPAAVEAVNARPDVAADNFIRFKEFFGKPIDGPTKLRSDLVSEEMRKALSRDYFSKDGMSPDDYASLFGYPNGNAMLAHLADWNAKVKASGMRPYEYKRLMINQELERRMEDKHGNFDKEVMQAAQDQVTSETQLNVLHEETIGLAHLAGEQFPLTKQALADAAKENFQNLNVEGQTVNRFLQAAGKAGRDVEMAHLAGDYATAFRQKQRQYYAMLYAKEAKTLEKAKADFAKTTKKFSSREVKGTDQEFTNFIHQLMIPAGLKVKRSVQDVDASIAGDGNTTLGDFVSRHQADGWELDVSPQVVEGQAKPVDQMTVAEFIEFKDAVDSLAYVGREVNKIEIAGQKAEFDDFVKEVVGKIQELPIRTPPEQRNIVGKLASRLWNWDAVLTRPEEMIKDLEGHEELGPLYRATIMGMMEGKHKRYQLEEELTKKMEKITTGNAEWMKTLDDTIPQDFFKDPYYDGQVLFDLDRKSMLNIMMNWGTKSNRAKFTRGYTKSKEESKALEASLQGLFDQHATKEDWDYVQSMWDIFKGWKKESGTLYRNLSGIEPKWVPEEPIKTPHGTYDGGYFPVIYDRLRSNIADIEEKSAGKDLFSKDYYRATTGNRYTKERTGYAAPIEFQRTLEQVVSRMMQQIHDIAYRAPVMQNAKIFGDKRIMAAIRKHYGPEYADQLMPWVKRVANNGNMDEKALGIANNLLRTARMNLTINALGLNSRVFLSPDMGQFNPVTAAKLSASAIKSLMQGEASPEVKLAWAHSKEIPHTYRNMDRDFREAIEQLEKKNNWNGFKVQAMKFAFLPAVKVSQAFRINTFVDEFKAGMAKGLPEADAAALADAAVRLRHGATGVTDLPAIMAGSEAMKTATIFYGYFSAMQQWTRQVPGNLRRGEYTNAMAALYGSILIPAAFSAVLFNKSAPTGSWFNDPKDPWYVGMAKNLAKAVAYQPTQILPFGREAATRLVEGYEPKTPWGTVFSAVEDGFGDAIEAASGKEPKRFIKTEANAVGLGLGLPMGQLGRSAQFAYDVAKHRQRPKNILDWINGVINGQIAQKGK